MFVYLIKLERRDQVRWITADGSSPDQNDAKVFYTVSRLDRAEAIVKYSQWEVSVVEYFPMSAIVEQLCEM